MNTYINDSMTSVYPFAAGTLLPFSCGVIRSIGVGVETKTDPNTPVVLEDVWVSGISVTDSRVSAQIIARVNGEDLSVGCHGIRGGACPVSSADRISAFIVPGIILDRDIGTYAGHWKIDPSCVLADSSYGTYQTLYVNGTRYTLSDILDIEFSGAIHTSMRTVSGNVEVSFLGQPTSDMRLNVQNEIVDYPQVTRINNQDVPTAGNTGGTLTLSASPSDDIKLHVQADQTNQDNLVWPSSIIVSIQGTSGIPVCMSQAGMDADTEETV